MNNGKEKSSKNLSRLFALLAFVSLGFGVVCLVRIAGANFSFEPTEQAIAAANDASSLKFNAALFTTLGLVSLILSIHFRHKKP